MMKELYIETDFNYWFKLIEFHGNGEFVIASSSNFRTVKFRMPSMDLLDYLKNQKLLWEEKSL